MGVTGVVGTVLLEVLDKYNFPINELHLFASEKSVGRKIIYKNVQYFVEELNLLSFKNIDFAFFVAGAFVSKKWVSIALADNAIVIDNSSYFRMQEDVALIVPEINFEDYNCKHKLVSNPNCSTIQSTIILNRLKKFGLKRILYNTYQSVSGSGLAGIKELENTIIGNLESYYPYNISKTCIPQVDVFVDNGYTKEEMKMSNETRKILHSPELKISATCIRVPVLYSHGVSVTVELENDFTISQIKEELSECDSIVVVDDIKNNIYPVSTIANKTDKVYVGRIRKDLSNNKTLLFYCVADNLYRGAASNAVLIALKIIENYG